MYLVCRLDDHFLLARKRLQSDYVFRLRQMLLQDNSQASNIETINS